MSDSLQHHELYSSWNSSGQNTGVGSHSLLQGIFLTHGLNPGLLHCRRILYQLSHKGSPRILEWVAHPFSSGSFQSRNRTGVSCIAGRFFTNWDIREAPSQVVLVVKNPPASAGRCKRHRFDPWVGKIPWRRAQQPTPVFLPGESHGQGSLVSYSLWGCEELDTSEVT